MSRGAKAFEEEGAEMACLVHSELHCLSEEGGSELSALEKEGLGQWQFSILEWVWTPETTLSVPTATALVQPLNVSHSDNY